MSLSARCPACATLFKVVPDQLKVSDGWVRCGQCGEVFDAHVPVAAAASTAPEPPESVPEIDIEFPVAPPSAQSSDALPSDVPPTEYRAASEPEASLAPPLPHVAPEVPHDEPPTIGFLADADPTQANRDARTRRGMGLAALLLAVVLVLQIAYFQRDRLAASAPALQPALVALCDLARCALAPVRQIESVALDSSTFTQLRPDAFRLSFVLKNESQIALAMPALEVTLTDNEDRAVVRRVVLPADFAPPDQPLAARGEFAGTLVLGLAAEGGNAANVTNPTEPRSSGITGYRLLAFYP